jgi:hypothetical protein
LVRKKVGGFIFESYKGDHSPLHVHISDDRGVIGRWDIENQRPMDDFTLGRKLRKALVEAGYKFEEK